MLKIIRSKIDPESRQKVAEDLKGYIKVVVDVKRRILAAGGEKHVDGEGLLLQDGSLQADLWGAGLDLETGEIDFDSLINLRPAQNTSREILDQMLRQQVESITRSLLLEWIMEARELILNIAVNLGRICRWAMEGRKERVEQFLAETEVYVNALEKAPKSSRFLPTYEWFKTDFKRLCHDVRMDANWAEAMLTWANILTHRASLA